MVSSQDSLNVGQQGRTGGLPDLDPSTRGQKELCLPTPMGLCPQPRHNRKHDSRSSRTLSEACEGVDGGGGLGLTKAERRKVNEGRYATIECAIRKDGSSPASDLLDELEGHIWCDPLADELPDAYQAKLYARLLAEIENLADGYDPSPQHLNYLDNGIWELKITNLRLTFYDTDGRGSPCTQHSDVEFELGRKVHCLPEQFGRAGIIRLGHHFPKQSQKTTERDLQLSSTVRREDLSLDRSDD